jgi:hypothetical protein
MCTVLMCVSHLQVHQECNLMYSLVLGTHWNQRQAKNIILTWNRIDAKLDKVNICLADITSDIRIELKPLIHSQLHSD